MKIGWSFWGSLEKPAESHRTATTIFTAVGERYILADEMMSRNHKLYLLQERREENPYPGVIYDSEGFPDIDVLYVEWRWPMAKNTGDDPSEPDWDRQRALLAEYSKRNIPIIAFDTDLKIRPEDEFRWNKMIISEPTMSHVKMTKRRIMLPWATDFKVYSEAPEYSYNYSYLGNNYERESQFIRYYGMPSQELRSRGIQTYVCGNWMENSSERTHPQTILKSTPCVSYGPRLSYSAGMKMLSNSICTTNISKDLYYEHGFVTCRIYESMLCGIPCIMPVEHKHLLSLGLNGSLVVSSPTDVVEKVTELQKMTKAERQEIVDNQLHEMKKLSNFSPSYKVDIIEGVGTKTITQQKIDKGEIL